MFDKLKKIVEKIFACNSNESSCCNKNKTIIITQCHKCGESIKCNSCSNFHKHINDVLFEKTL